MHVLVQLIDRVHSAGIGGGGMQCAEKQPSSQCKFEIVVHHQCLGTGRYNTPKHHSSWIPPKTNGEFVSDFMRIRFASAPDIVLAYV